MIKPPVIDMLTAEVYRDNEICCCVLSIATMITTPEVTEEVLVDTEEPLPVCGRQHLINEAPRMESLIIDGNCHQGPIMYVSDKQFDKDNLCYL